MTTQDISGHLENLARSTKDAQAAITGEMVRCAQLAVREKIKSGHPASAELRQLDQELATWLAKLNVIFKEQAGRQGMAKHALHWAERLKHVG